MKKSYLMIAAAAALFAACSNTDTFKEAIGTENLQINFSTFTQKATRAENSNQNYTWDLSDHHNKFKVWGYKNTSATAVFNGDEVRWNTTVNPNAWTYTNNRYWDKAATTYQFYAFAPYDAPFTFDGVSGVDSQGSGFFKITSSYNKAGENVSPKNSTSKVDSWTTAGAATDVDLMIAENKTLSAPINYSEAVQLNFIHVLSRLNITVKTTDDFYPTENKDKVKVMDITIGNMISSGTFSENNGNLTAAQKKETSARWDKTGASKINYVYNFGSAGWEADHDARYVIETLIIPQETNKSEMHLDGRELTGESPTTDAYIKITYRVYSTDTVFEEFITYYNLATIFNVADNNTLAFNEGWQNNLNITIAPGIIKFAANVAVWDANETDASKTID